MRKVLVSLLVVSATAVIAGTVFETDGTSMSGWETQWHAGASPSSVAPIWTSKGGWIVGVPFHSEHHDADLGGMMFNTNAIEMAIGDKLTFTMQWQGKGRDIGENHWWYSFGLRTGGDEAWVPGDIVVRSSFRSGVGAESSQGFIAWNIMDDSWTEPFPHCEMKSDENYKSDVCEIIWSVERTASGFGPSTITVLNKATGETSTAIGTANHSGQVLPGAGPFYFFHEMPATFMYSGEPPASAVGTAVKVSRMKLVVGEEENPEESSAE